MKFSYQWIAELVSGLDMQPAELKRLITMKTAECEAIEVFGEHWTHVIIARVLAVEPLAAGRNRLVTIDVGAASTRQVVCGAPNVRVGMLAAWVPPGTVLGGKRIGTAVIDGQESDGMLASAAELQAGRNHSGLLELHTGEPGQPLAGMRPDWIIEIDNKSLTHRPDLWGHFGMAREISAIAACPLLDPVPASAAAREGLSPGGLSPFRVYVEDSARCSRYSALLFENITVSDSPLPLAARLEGVGMNSINNVVDVTNYVLAELPQPMHAFDADKLTGDTIFVRQAHRGERLAALNGETYTLHPDDLVIADASGAIALAGVIGGASTAISDRTKRILLESANFAATGVRLTSVRHKLRTDASARFEKSLDPENTLRGLLRALHLLRQVCPAAHPAGGIVDVFTPPAPPPPIALPPHYVSRKLGRDVRAEQVSSILRSLGFGVEHNTVTVPSWRATKDISNKADLVEEIGRIIGYDEIVPVPPLAATVVPYCDPARLYLRQVRTRVVNQGFTEIYAYSFLNPAQAQRFEYNSSQLLAIANPIAADLSHMRPSLLPGVFQSILNNVRHLRDFRLFEIGREIHPRPERGLPDEVPHLVAAIYSAHADEQEFFEMKRLLECVLPGARVQATAARSYEHPTRTAAVHWRQEDVGRIFELHPALLEEQGVEGRAVLLDLNLQSTAKLEALQTWTYRPPRRFPTSGLDLSVVADRKAPVAAIHDGLVELAGDHLALIEFVRQYDGPPLLPGQKSVTYHLQVGALDHTVTTEEVTAIRNRIVEGMRNRGFDFRG